jgi:hypothetical protein
MEIELYGHLCPVMPKDVRLAAYLFSTGCINPPTVGYTFTLIQVLLHG